jgi:hypothetical protein
MTKHFGLAFGSLIWQKIRCAIERWRFSVVSSARGIGELNREFSNMVKLFRQKDEVPTDNVPRTSTSSSSPLEKITSSVIMIVSTDPPDGWMDCPSHSLPTAKRTWWRFLEKSPFDLIPGAKETNPNLLHHRPINPRRVEMVFSCHPWRATMTISRPMSLNQSSNDIPFQRCFVLVIHPHLKFHHRPSVNIISFHDPSPNITKHFKTTFRQTNDSMTRKFSVNKNCEHRLRLLRVCFFSLTFSFLSKYCSSQ